ncbi:putative dihydroxyacetone kinase [Trichodelitschia bisporula]|uniref:Putative dihydroxyacetone kinase n=1 Tax=Trichodelitschia bisporula TaxID=703511 RepID=A0A6G1HPD1_9PEZI|nr:putative dihydroxyacetone kinase [Trichodelitschia bisporula]
MSTKHFIPDPTALVNTALRSLTLTHPGLSLDTAVKTVYRTPHPSSPFTAQVSLVSGGGSGHEPAFAGYVGSGLLAASVAGTIFASPSAEQIRRCLLARVPKEKGVCVIVMNYTGDVLNFGMAVEKAKASGVEAEMVIVGDDVGVGRERGGKVGRRGIAGTVLVLKVAGALAEKGYSLKDVTRIARLAADNVVSIGASLEHVHVPGRSTEVEDALGEDEIEVGMGIHNEPGSERIKTDLPGLVKKMLQHMLDQSDSDRAFINVSKADKTVLLVNNLGGVSVLEMGGITDEVVRQLKGEYGIEPVRVLAGTFMTSLNGLGFSISLLKVQDTGLGKGCGMLELLDAPAEAPGWSAAIKTGTWDVGHSQDPPEEQEKAADEEQPSNLKFDRGLAKSALTAGLNKVIAAEPDVTNYDTIVGDGDCGIGLQRGAEAILKMLEKSKPTDDAVVFVQRIAQVVEFSMDGTSGAIYAIFLNALAHALREQSALSPAQLDVEKWAKALQQSTAALGRYTPARLGDRTLIDALHPFVGTLAKSGDVHQAAAAAEAGARETKGMKASLGRTVYVGGEDWQGVPDPGAYGLAQFLLGLSEGLQ